MSALAYADTSFLISLYGDDDFTAAAQAAVSVDGLALLLCDLNRLEFENALRLLRFRKLITARFAADAFSAFDHDARAGLLRPVALAWPQVFAVAQQLSEGHTVKNGCRAMDILHVAAAATQSVDRFYSFDERQRRLAKQAGLALNREPRRARSGSGAV